jgi:hypothetical protein
VASARDESPNFVKMLLTCRATVFSLMMSPAALAVGLAGGDEREHLSLARTLPSWPR